MNEVNTDTKILSVDELLGAQDRPTKTVDMPEWGGSVVIQAMSLGSFQDAQDASTVGGELDEQRMAIETIIRGVVQPQMTAEHAALLRDKSIGALTRLMVEIATLSKVTQEDLKAAERQFPADAG